jgi:ATP-dependent exoDNAse (exonuclease V) beta subunit
MNDGIIEERNAAIARLLQNDRREQREAITSGEKLTVVSAGAGTGKTHTLAERFAWLLASDPSCRVEQILTLTFTQLAANEMRERIKTTLRKWHDAEPERLKHLRDAAERIDEARVSTIHAFAVSVIRESGLSLDIDPGASLVSGAFENEFWEDYRWSLQTLAADRLSGEVSGKWRVLAEKLMSSPDGCAEFVNLFGAEKLSRLSKEACDTFGSVNENPVSLLLFGKRRERAVTERIGRIILPVCRAAWEIWRDDILRDGAVLGEANKKRTKLGDNILGLASRWRDSSGDDEAVLKFTADLVTNALSGLPGNSGLKDIIEGKLGMKLVEWMDTGGLKAVAALAASLVSDPRYTVEEARARRALLASTALGWELWDEARLRAGRMTFSDLVRYAARVIKSGSYQNGFRHVMIDEFQDTDGLQAEMLSAIADNLGASLFVVGDIKQSIYRFRHADPTLFAEYIKRAGEGNDAAYIPLSCSFRMSGALMSAINRIFASIWRGGVIGGGINKVRYEPLAEPDDADWWESRNKPGGFPPAAILTYDTALDDEPPSVDEARASLASSIAARLRDMRKSGCEVWDKGKRKMKPIEWRDMAVLVPSRGQYRAIEAAFGDAGIPVVFGSGKSYFNRGEVRDIVNFLHALDDPYDGYALAGWIESPFSGVKPSSALAMIAGITGDRAEGPAAPLWDVFSETMPEAAERFSALRSRARLKGASSAILALLESGTETQWLASYKDSERPRVLANLLRAADIAREYEVAGASFSSCADSIGRAMRGGVSADEPEFSEPDGDFVQVKTIHASKGEEFPVVVIMGMESAVIKPAGGASVSRALGVVSPALPRFDGKSVTYMWHKYTDEAEERAEKERLLYVAMTRARDYLLCCGIACGKDSGAAWLDMLREANDAAGGEKMPVEYANGGARITRNAYADQQRQEVRFPVFKKSRAPSLGRFSATAYSLISWCPLAYRLRYRQGLPLRWETRDGDGFGGADIGSLAHWALERWDMTPDGAGKVFPADLTAEELDRELRALPADLRPVFASSKNRGTLRSWLENFASTDEGIRVRGASVQKETPFFVPLRMPSAKASGTILAGSVDLMWEDERGIHVRDWKTALYDGSPSELYVEQVNFYALAVKLAGAEYASPIDAGVIYLRSNDGAPFFKNWPAPDLEAIGEKVARAAQMAAAGPFEPNEQNCEACPFGKSCGKK